MSCKVLLIGYGTVGRAFVEILAERGPDAQPAISLLGVATRSRGCIYSPNGLDPALLLEKVKPGGSLGAYPDGEGLQRDGGIMALIENTEADCVVDASPTSLAPDQPAITWTRAAFHAGKHMVTVNKGPAAIAYTELIALAREKQVAWGVEGTVMSGTPVLRLVRSCLPGARIREVKGLLNGTTNFMLCRMSEGQSYESALAEAQKLGYAEPDPTADVEGHDCVAKVLILAGVLLGADLSPEDVPCVGITGLKPADFEQAAAEGKVWKLVSHIYHEEGKPLRVCVQPEALPKDNALAGVSGANNAVTFSTDLLGGVTVTGPGAGPRETGYALYADLLNIIAHGADGGTAP